MDKLVPQRKRDDCSICCIAMALGMPWEEVHEVASKTKRGYVEGYGTRSVGAVLSQLGYDTKTYAADEPEFPPILLHLLWGRRAILSLPSLNGWNGWHDVYWDGFEVFDPTYSDNKYPSDLPSDTKILGVTLIRERP